MSEINRHHKKLIFILFLGLALRLVFLMSLEDKIYWHDGQMYDSIARNLICGNGYVSSEGVPTAYRAPGYPFFLAGIYSVFGESLLAVRMVQCVLDILTIMFIYLICVSIFNSSVAIISASVCAVYPLFIYTSSTYFPTTLFTFLLSAIMFVLISHEKRADRVKASVLGLLFGMAGLTIPVILAFAPLALLWFVFSRGRFSMRRAQLFALTMVVLTMTLFPWMARNYHVHGKPFLIATNSGYNFWMGNNPFSSATTGNSINVPDTLNRKIDTAEAEVLRDKLFYKDALTHIKQKPMKYALLTIQKAINLWRLYPDPDTGYRMNALAAKGLSMISFGSVLILAIWGVFLAWWQITRRRYLFLFMILFAAFTIIYAIFITKVRFRIPLDPYIIVLASYALSQIVNKLRIQEHLSLNNTLQIGLV